MSDTYIERFSERRHALPAAEREAELAVLTKISRHFASFAGTPREAYDAMTAWTPVVDGMTLKPVAEQGVEGWWVKPPRAPHDRAILFLHGGGYRLGSAKAYRGFASQVAARAGVAAFVLDYPLAPEHPFPAAPEAVSQARRWLAGQGVEQIALVGDSAGGGLALGSLGDRDATSPAVASAALFSPWTDLALTGTSMTDPNTHDPIFKAAILAVLAASYLGNADPRNGLASPLYAVPDALPPIAIQVGTDELLRDDALDYAAAATAKGGTVDIEVFEGLYHVFQRSTESLPAARRALDSIGAFISRHWA